MGSTYDHSMYCPQCGTESGSGLQYCRSCGANLKVINKALTLSEAIARSDRGPLPKLKEIVRSLHVENVGEEVSRALERMNREIMRTSPSGTLVHLPKSLRRQKSFAERRENHVVKGTATLFSGIGVMIFLYYLAAALILKIPPEVAKEMPFEPASVVHVIWLVGLIPALSGAGRLIAGLAMRPHRTNDALPVSTPTDTKSDEDEYSPPSTNPISVTENTTSLLEPQNRPN